MTEHVFLVGIVVDTSLNTPVSKPLDESREGAEEALHAVLRDVLNSRHPDSPVESWWVAEDDRRDGSDLDSATFCKKGHQEEATSLLRQGGLAHRYDQGSEDPVQTVARAMVDRGMVIFDRSWGSPLGHLNLIARDGETLVVATTDRVDQMSTDAVKALALLWQAEHGITVGDGGMIRVERIPS